MNSDGPPSFADESRLKTILVVVVTVVALFLMVVRPFFADNAQDADNEQENRFDKTAKQNLPQKKSTVESDDPRTKTAELKSLKKKESAGDAQSGSGVSSDGSLPSRKKQPKSDSRNPVQKPRGPPTTKSIATNSKGLEQLSKDTYRSKAGLIYGPGSRDKHRLTHVLKHSKDDLTKPIHGVFDGKNVDILQLIDQGYERIKSKHKSVTPSRSGSRTAYSVYFNKRIGYVGGKAGKRDGNPAAKTLVLVLDENRVITAYPK